MPQIHTTLNRRTFLMGATALGATLALHPALAWADDEATEETEETEPTGPTSEEKFAEADAVHQRILALQDELSIAVEEYYKALDEHDAAVQAVEDAQAQIDEATTQIDDLQDTLAKRARAMYRDGQTTTFDLLLGATSFEEFAVNWSLLSILNEEDSKMIAETKDLRNEVEELKVTLEEEEQIAADKIEEAERIKSDTEESIQQLEELRAQLDAEALELLEKEQVERAAEYAERSRKMYAYSSSTTRAIPSHGSVIDYALSRIGCPYVWGAEGPDAFDCSGLVRWAYLQIGISLPHQTEALYHAADARLPISEAQPGDVLWVGYGDGFNGHVGIALTEGGTKYVHAPTFGAFVRDTDDLAWAGFTHCLRFKGAEEIDIEAYEEAAAEAQAEEAAEE